VLRPRPMTLLALLVALGLLLAACGGGTASDGSGGDGGDGGDGDAGETVSLSGGAFSPSTLTIPIGSTVTFTNGAGHTVTNGSDGTAVADPIVDQAWNGEPIVVTFEEAGIFPITCKIHPNMNMTITVEG
jgi:plastocyanin